MGLIQRIADLAGYIKRDATLPIDPSWAALSRGAIPVTSLSPLAAENLSGALACINAISTALAQLPVVIYQRKDNGDRTELSDHPLAVMYRNGPNADMTWPELIEHLFASTLLNGAGYAIVEHDPTDGRLESLRYVPFTAVSPVILDSGKLAFDITGFPSPLDGTKRFLRSQIVNLRDRTDDGRIGRSRLVRSQETVNAAWNANRFASQFMANSATPCGLLTAPGAISKETADRLKGTWDENFAGVQNAGKIAVGGDGLKFEQLTVNPQNAQLLETKKFSIIEFCMLYQVPPPIVQQYENNTFTNSYQANLWFGQNTLAPWARKLEAEIGRVALADEIEFEFDLSGLLKGDPLTRAQTNKIYLDSGVLTADEVRQQEGWNPLTPAQRKQIEDARKSAPKPAA